MQWRRRLRGDPHTRDWWVAVLFMVGSFLFAIGSFPLYAQFVDPGTVAITFVAGSVFFTSAAALQLRSSYDAEDRRLVCAAAVQLVGTILFNLNTVDAMFESLDTEQTNRLVWAPDSSGQPPS